MANPPPFCARFLRVDRADAAAQLELFRISRYHGLVWPNHHLQNLGCFSKLCVDKWSQKAKTLRCWLVAPRCSESRFHPTVRDGVMLPLPSYGEGRRDAAAPCSLSAAVRARLKRTCRVRRGDTQVFIVKRWYCCVFVFFLFFLISLIYLLTFSRRKSGVGGAIITSLGRHIHQPCASCSVLEKKNRLAAHAMSLQPSPPTPVCARARASAGLAPLTPEAPAVFPPGCPFSRRFLPSF